MKIKNHYIYTRKKSPFYYIRFTPEELRALFPVKWETVWPDRRAYVSNLLAATTGMRLSEIQGLLVKHVNTDTKSIRILRSWDGRLNQPNRTPKNKKTREIELSDTVFNEIQLLIEENPEPGNREAFLFPGEKPGLPMDKKYFPRHFKKAIRKSGINTEDRHFSFHCYRHTVNTLLIEAGVNPFKVAAYLGHSRNDMTALYHHSNIRDHGDIRLIFENLLKPSPNITLLRHA